MVPDKLNINFTPFPQIETDRLLLRQFRKEDKYDVYKLRSDKRVSEFIHRKLCNSYDEALTYINLCNTFISKNESVIWAVCTLNEGKFIGTICLWNILREHLRCEIGFEVFPEYQGKGFMSEAVENILRFGFNDMNLHSIEGRVIPGNVRSIKLLEKFGFVKEGQFRDYFFHKGKFYDMAVYSLLKKSNLT